MDAGGTNPQCPGRETWPVCVFFFFFVVMCLFGKGGEENTTKHGARIAQRKWRYKRLNGIKAVFWAVNQATKARVEKSPKMSHIKPQSKSIYGGEKSSRWRRILEFIFIAWLLLCLSNSSVWMQSAAFFSYQSSRVKEKKSLLFVLFQKAVTLSIKVGFVPWRGICSSVLFVAWCEVGFLAVLEEKRNNNKTWLGS